MNARVAMTVNPAISAPTALVPGNAEKSRLYRMVAGLEKPAMPLDGKLTAEQVETIKLWIDQGLAWDASAVAAPVSGPMSSNEDPPLPPAARVTS